jgi:hypothetical protein
MVLVSDERVDLIDQGRDLDLRINAAVSPVRKRLEWPLSAH